MRDVHVLNATFCVKFVKPFIFESMQRVKTGLLNKSYSARCIHTANGFSEMPRGAAECGDKAVWSLSSISPGLFQAPRCADHLLKIYLLSGQHTVDCKSPHETLVWTRQILLSREVIFLPGYVKQLGQSRICCIFHGNH